MKPFRKPNTQIIEFRLKEALDERVHLTPQPAYQFVPKWFKDMPRFMHGDDKIHIRPSNLTAKHCVPLLDGFTGGYMLVTPFELDVHDAEKVMPSEMMRDPNITISTPAPLISHSYPGVPCINQRELELASGMPTPPGCYPGVWTWETPMQIITPKGYSVMFMHPVNRYDLPFITAGGVIDTDKNGGYGGSIPFYLRKDFRGIIPKGTPYLQIVPFKRENWKKYDSPIREELLGVPKARTQSVGYYKENNWSKKTYR
jgi:hypothetical protein